MTLSNPRPGANWASEYMISAIPWVTSSTANGVVRHEFGDSALSSSCNQNVYVSKWIVVSNITTNGTNLHVAFTNRGLLTTNNYFTLKPDQSFAADLRVSELHVSGAATAYEVVAGLTGIYASQSPAITASLGFPCVG